ncbi:aldehyde dehydrogenase domain-containing protein [Lipomyces oligophaga]|uniref:aldehyde dehydrogenase domain-containing protein n=1 Tax=Lipomyces oligophaga TaxID=45792 RepID=UPI0034CF367A
MKRLFSSKSQAKVFPIIIDNKHIISNDSSTWVPFYSPNNRSEPLHYAQGASVEHAFQAARSSAAAFRKWREVPAIERREILLAAADILEKRRSDGVEIAMSESIPEKGMATFFYNGAIIHLKEWASQLTTALRPIMPISESNNAMPIIYREPIGPVLGIAPWNAASILALRSFGTPIAAGCTSVYKTSDLALGSQLHMAQALIDAGLPPGVLNVLHVAPSITPEIITALINSTEIKKINFTGSTELGRKLAIQAAQNLKPILLELGGKAAAVVLCDANLQAAVNGILVGAWLNQGQICMSTERVFVSRKILDRFMDLLLQSAEQMRTAFGRYPQVSPQHAMKIYEMIRSACEQGATLEFGTLVKPTDSQIEVTILSNVDPTSDIYSEETFGPTFVVVPFDSETDMIEAVNTSRYGLTASVWTQDIMRGIKIARRIDSGAVHINDMTVHDESTLPHGGVKDSGYGRFGAEWGLQEFTVTKTVRISGFDSVICS